MWKTGLLWLNLLTCAACQTSAVNPPKPFSAGAFSAEYQQSSVAARSKYDGKEIAVRGFAETAANLPRATEDQGSILLKAKESNSLAVTCWFSREQTQEFSKITGGQYITVKGVFNGEAGLELKFCKLVRIEAP